jgi:hypothetical protein
MRTRNLPCLHVAAWLVLSCVCALQPALAWAPFGATVTGRSAFRNSSFGALGARCSNAREAFLARRDAIGGVAAAAFLGLKGPREIRAESVAASSMATIAMSAAAIGFRETTLNVGGESVPLSVRRPALPPTPRRAPARASPGPQRPGRPPPAQVWYPTKGAAGSSGPGKYTYPLSIGTIAARLGKLPTPTWLALPICVRGDARAVVPGAPLPAPEEAPPAVFFAHGFLPCSRSRSAPSRTNWTRLVPPVQTGRVSSPPHPTPRARTLPLPLPLLIL